ncbi:hypothetical protein T440DRAFT_473452 [Plenodomus tracheiphilus IPT5]|uniref:Uncharacterized protein n=1 Tax=Plenodomus tracheiphilus IPT5 TaxID=1408161 RepID=A0A6A7AQB1_9PLEO|nr:hypothetical protein T440DRAFT_473452 [Plenodomus tracheiphilus IPT5]
MPPTGVGHLFPMESSGRPGLQMLNCMQVITLTDSSGTILPKFESKPHRQTPLPPPQPSLLYSEPREKQRITDPAIPKHKINTSSTPSAIPRIPTQCTLNTTPSPTPITFRRRTHPFSLQPRALRSAHLPIRPGSKKNNPFSIASAPANPRGISIPLPVRMRICSGQVRRSCVTDISLRVHGKWRCGGMTRFEEGWGWEIY